jgi:hypothetical protein
LVEVLPPEEYAEAHPGDAWWEPGEWDCHCREETLALLRERAGAVGVGLIDAGPDAVLLSRTTTVPEGPAAGLLPIRFRDREVVANAAVPRKRGGVGRRLTSGRLSGALVTTRSDAGSGRRSNRCMPLSDHDQRPKGGRGGRSGMTRGDGGRDFVFVVLHLTGVGALA